MLNFFRPHKLSGFTLIELMIAMTVGLIVTGAAIAMYVTAIKGSSNAVKSAKLTDEVGFVMTMMSNDIRRAGYWGNAVAGSDATTNPFKNIYFPLGTNCILYSYDVDADGTVDDDEKFGFKYDSANKKIRIKTTDTTATPTSCSTGTWLNLTNFDEVAINSVTFCGEGLKWTNYTANSTGPASTAVPTLFDGVCSTIDPSSTNETDANPAASGEQIVEVRQVDIVIQAEHASDSTIQIELQQSVRLPNNNAYTE